MDDPKPTLDYGRRQRRGPLPLTFWLFLSIAVFYLIAWLMG